MHVRRIPHVPRPGGSDLHVARFRGSLALMPTTFWMLGTRCEKLFGKTSSGHVVDKESVAVAMSVVDAWDRVGITLLQIRGWSYRWSRRFSCCSPTRRMGATGDKSTCRMLLHRHGRRVGHARSVRVEGPEVEGNRSAWLEAKQLTRVVVLEWLLFGWQMPVTSVRVMAGGTYRCRPRSVDVSRAPSFSKVGYHHRILSAQVAPPGRPKVW